MVAGEGGTVGIRVEIVEGPSRGRSTELRREGNILIGRASDAELRVDGDNHISRYHFSVRLERAVVEVVDLGSANGTLLNGHRVDKDHVLTHGDVLAAGQSTFRVLFIIARPEKKPSGASGRRSTDHQRRRIRCRSCDRLVVFERATVLVDDEGHVVSQPGMDSDFVCKDCRPTDEAFGHVQFPGYRAVEQLGEGSMGSVFLVERNTDGALFALKRLRPDATLSEDDVKRFLREAAALSVLRHRNIIGFVDQGYVEGEFYFLMDFVEGVDLDLYRRQAGGRVPLARCISLMGQILDGLDHAHRQGFIHRDVKPANILVGVQDGAMTPRLTDFGLAKRYEAVALDPITRGHISFGTPDYMPPEQITQFRDIGPSSDIYAVGATIYHLLSGKTLYEGVAGPDPIRTLLDRDPPPLVQRAPFVPESVATVVQRSIARKPADRWATAAAFRDGLVQALRLA